MSVEYDGVPLIGSTYSLHSSPRDIDTILEPGNDLTNYLPQQAPYLGVVRAVYTFNFNGMWVYDEKLVLSGDAKTRLSREHTKASSSPVV